MTNPATGANPSGKLGSVVQGIGKSLPLTGKRLRVGLPRLVILTSLLASLGILAAFVEPRPSEIDLSSTEVTSDDYAYVVGEGSLQRQLPIGLQETRTRPGESRIHIPQKLSYLPARVSGRYTFIN